MATMVVCSGDLFDEQVSIWYGAILRGDLNAIRINSYSNVQDKTVIHAARYGPGCRTQYAAVCEMPWLDAV